MSPQALHDIRRKQRILNHAKESGNVSQTYRYFGISRENFYRWKRAYEKGGETALIYSKPCPQNPKCRTPPHIEEKILHLRRVRLPSRWMQESFQRLLEQYEFLSEQIGRQTRLLRELAKPELYRERVRILCSVPGVGLIAAMELLLELQDVARFRRADELAAYVGLTPSQHSSAEKVRMGRITKVGKGSLRAMLVEASWLLIRKDSAMKQTYERIKLRSGGKRAIVAVARRLLLRTRRMLLDGREYAPGFAG